MKRWATKTWSCHERRRLTYEMTPPIGTERHQDIIKVIFGPSSLKPHQCKYSTGEERDHQGIMINRVSRRAVVGSRIRLAIDAANPTTPSSQSRSPSSDTYICVCVCVCVCVYNEVIHFYIVAHLAFVPFCFFEGRRGNYSKKFPLFLF
jgi:hypothetical protein